MAALAALAVAIGASVAAALLHVSGDVGAKLTRELRSLGPNLVLAPADPGGRSYLDEATVRARTAAAGVQGAAVLYATAFAGGHAIPVAGADVDALWALHPTWKRGAGFGLLSRGDGAQCGAGLARRMGWREGQPAWLASPDGTRRFAVAILGVFATGTSDEEALWLSLPTVQRLAARPGQVSLVQARIEGGA